MPPETHQGWIRLYVASLSAKRQKGQAEIRRGLHTPRGNVLASFRYPENARECPIEVQHDERDHCPLRQAASILFAEAHST